MPPVKLSVACMAITDSIVENYGEIILSDTNAEQIFGVKKEIAVKDLTTTQLLPVSYTHLTLPTIYSV